MPYTGKFEHPSKGGEDPPPSAPSSRSCRDIAHPFIAYSIYDMHKHAMPQGYHILSSLPWAAALASVGH